ncbi:MAG: branched-chain amino acid transaminase [Acidobacteria bacterium]|nr:branched-chain amino acid transaminase [Acidobacteriota bacterium]MBI3663666.1 branched-chain amino acid transaminase [Acidobacteriota bacterium]
MSVKPTEKIWHNGKLIPWDDAKIHVLSHVVSYGSGIFEGIRCYHTPQGPAIFRLKEHMQRLLNSARIYRMEIPYKLDELMSVATELVRANKMDACYVKPIVIRGYGEVGVNPLPCPIDVFMACWAWGKYLGADAIEQGVDVCVSSWARMAGNTLPAMAKSAANYMNSQLIRMEAIINGYVEGIALDVNGCVSEGSGENIFVVYEGTVLTPPLANSVLPGITRSAVMTLCHDLGIPVQEQMIPREMLYIAEEVFLVGTATEISPVRSIDRSPIGKGSRGPITKRLQDEFFALVQGEKPDRHGWLTLVHSPVSANVR